MKKYILISLVSLLIFSCKKEINSDSDTSFYKSNIIASLKDSLTDPDFANIDFTKSVITKTGATNFFLRMPFKGKKLSDEFVFLYTDSIGKILKSSIIKLKQDISANNMDYGYNGTIEISYLNRRINIISKIKNGYITAFHKREVAQRRFVNSMAREELPDIIADYSYLVSNGGMPSYSINSWGFFGFNSGGYSDSNSANYSSIDGASNDERDPGSRSQSRGFDEDKSEVVDFEFVEDKNPINITQYLKCFSNISDIGSSCTIKILIDIPVDEKPNRLFNFQQGSPGHTFLQITKTNGSQSVTQNIGFYPTSTWKLLLTEPVESKFVDNSEHEYNASLQMSITPDQLTHTLNHLSSLSNRSYDIDDYNCTDLALEVFNDSRGGNPIEIQKVPILGGITANGSSTPGALYNKLNLMQHSNIESQNINIPTSKAFVGDSGGPCN